MSHPQKIPSIPDGIPPDFEELDFTIVEENWNEYELNDGNRIMARIIVRRIRRDPNHPENFSIDSVPPLYVVYASLASRGERNNEPNYAEYEKLPNYEIKIVKSDEKWNVYRILRTGQMLRIKLIVTAIRRATNRFDKDGLPFYLITAGPIVVMDPINVQSGQ